MRKLWASLLWLKVTGLAAAPPVQPHADQIFTYVQAEQLEYRIASNGSGTLAWDVRGWAGGDYNRVWFKTQGDNRIGGPVENGEVQLRYNRLVTPFWDLAVGARYDVEPDPSRAYAVFALHGLAPYLYEVDADMFISEEGDVSARLEVEYPILITQRLILQPSFELDFAVQEVKALRIGPGLSQVELGLRLRYEIVRELAPYIGFVWERKVGRTADLAKGGGEAYDTSAFVAGVRFWF
ncbi:MAG: copper resistance protein B [Pseudomonadota bacterium]|nr:copper resistance protein B [Pseudomonadota bacterium]